MSETEVLLLLTTVPDAAHAERIARLLVDKRLAACVNILAPCSSVYRWHERIEAAAEVPLLIKTTGACFPALQAALVEAHPYELPEIIAVPIVAGLPAYLSWVASESVAP